MRPADVFPGLFFVLLTLGGTPAFADPPEKANETHPGETAPSLELLEYLGEFETEDGEWIDPEELEQMDNIDDNLESSKDRENRRD